MSTESLTLSQKIALFLQAREDFNYTRTENPPEGRAWKDSVGKFTIHTRLYFTKADGVSYFTSYQPRLTEEAALRARLYGFLKKQGTFTCPRCGGAGGSSHWPGFTCYDCGGDGVDHKLDIEKELDRALAGEEFGGDYISAHKARVEKQKRDQEQSFIEAKAKHQEALAKFKADNAGLFDRAKSCLAYLGLASTGPWGVDLRHFIGYEHSENAIHTGVEHIEQLCAKIERQRTEKERQAAVSGHLGQQGVRQDFTARIVAVIHLPVTDTRDFEKYLTILHDADGNVIKYWNRVNVPEPTEQDPKAKRPAVKDERVTFSATVSQHSEYQGVKETLIQRVTKGKLA